MNSAARPRISDICAMSENALPLTEDILMATPAEADSDRRESSRLGAIRQAMVSSARGGHHSVPAADAEDVVQEAIIKYLGRPAAEGVAEEARAFTALRDARADYYRRRSRRPEVLTGEVLPLPSKPADERLIEAALTIEQIAGGDARLYCEYKQKGYTQSDIGRLAGWSPQRAAAAYKQVQRHHQQLASALEIKLKENHGT
jgi:DNA-directed RNA polymerase specialized sigma24 family protein